MPITTEQNPSFCKVVKFQKYTKSKQSRMTQFPSIFQSFPHSYLNTFLLLYFLTEKKDTLMMFQIKQLLKNMIAIQSSKELKLRKLIRKHSLSDKTYFRHITRIAYTYLPCHTILFMHQQRVSCYQLLSTNYISFSLFSTFDVLK